MAAAPRPDARFELVDGSLPPSETPPPRGRRRAPLAVAVAFAALLVVGVTALNPPTREAADRPPEPAAPSSNPRPTIPATDCDLTDPACRVTQADRWRERTAGIVRSRVDPANRYFTGYSWGPGSPYEQGQRLEALGLEVYRLEGGGTEVFIQIAKSPADAVRCGELTRHRCSTRSSSDGGRLVATATTQVSQGIEVQFVPTGSYVITLVGRNITEARPLDLDVEELIAIAHDPRLRPPPS